MKSIKSKLLLSHFFIIMLVTTLFSTLFLYGVQRYYYQGAKEAFAERVDVLSAYYNKFINDETLREKATEIFQQLPTADYMSVQVLDMSGKVLMDANGFQQEGRLSTPDIARAIQTGEGSWTGRAEQGGEHLMAYSYALYREESAVGVVRFVTSLSAIDELYAEIVMATLVLSLGIIGASFIVSLFLSSRMVGPLLELRRVANAYIKGDFHVRSDNRRRDEIAVLGQTMNVMAEEIMKTDKLKHEFISTVSHELRTPLTFIQGWSETLLTGDMQDKEELLDGLQTIQDEAKRLNGMVNDLLDFSKLQAKHLEMHPTRWNVGELLNELKIQFSAHLKQKGIKLRTEYDASAGYITADRNRIKQVLINLLDNAIKFSHGDGEVLLRAQRYEQELQLEVIDEGEGIAPADLEKMMTKFFKGKSKQSGSGIGLALAKEIIELHGGSMSMNSELHKGTTVTIKLPLDSSVLI
ncbi:HAMP domain-containing sensor histidine kinase [Paenibacillus sp. D2_2]|uniref:sensor histidine kinase n=1 Tax=Paenibacillus sp. D2_2 TaxID=3073092 RepID=UPI00281671E1|nr:HAMP domain-containing sensor histidine kinase [Paenibacillus sp. D2_2]WMT40005.1 HAMP domain-containing sensor histidine kinase [Paenibacillus sp. D2_2]